MAIWFPAGVWTMGYFEYPSFSARPVAITGLRHLPSEFVHFQLLSGLQTVFCGISNVSKDIYEAMPH